MRLRMVFIGQVLLQGHELSPVKIHDVMAKLDLSLMYYLVLQGMYGKDHGDNGRRRMGSS
jgi:hypothetical protein